jgi:SSS family solute:Na+ symporter
VLFGLGWVPFMQVISSEIYTYLQSVQAYISPPIAAVFLVGILWPRANSKGAIAALAVGFVLGFGRLWVELAEPAAGTLLGTFATINFLHFAVLLFAISIAALVGVSLATQAPDPAQLRDLTFATLQRPGAESVGGSPKTRRADVALSVLLVVVIAAIWICFS